MDALSKVREYLVAGDDQSARQLIVEILRTDQNNIEAWQIALALCTSEKDRQQARAGLKKAMDAQTINNEPTSQLIENVKPVAIEPSPPNVYPKFSTSDNELLWSKVKHDTPLPTSETIYFQDNTVQITSLQARFGESTYAIGRILSVEIVEKRPDPKLWIILAVIGSLMIMFGINESRLCAAPGILLLGAGIYIVNTAKSKFALKFASSTAEAHAITSKDRAYIAKLAEAVNQAITHGS